VRVPIRVLAEEVASAIAAGEVVERPVSVVKELLENAIDAGARDIRVTIRGGGRTLVEVADDGCGIPASELPLAVARYATSKIRQVDDLFAIRTLGFRGEALSSIAAVSRLEITSRAQAEMTGSRLRVEGGRSGMPEPVGAPQGTVVQVRDLFFNTPARLKFLKSETTERQRIEAVVSRYAIAYPGVRIRLEQDGRVSLQSPGSGDRLESLAAVYGLDVARQMVALPAQPEAPVQVSGYVGTPEVHRSNRREMTFFVNGRWVQDPSLSAAVVQAYHGLLMVGRYPMVLLLIEVPAEAVDVNVHPAKAEVRFRQPEVVFGVLQRQVRSTLLGQGAATPFRPDSTGWRSPGEAVGPRPSPDWVLAGGGTTPSLPVPQSHLPGGPLPLLRAVGQVGTAYVVAEGPDGIYLVDQHAAHERVLFEKLLRARDTGPVDVQTLLEAVVVEFPSWQAAILQDQTQALAGLGFRVEPFGSGAFRLRGLPALLAGLDPARALRAVVEDFEEDETPLAEESEARLAARVCKRAAVKVGQVLSLTEQESLLRDLESCESPRTCPHGRPTMIHLSVESLERQFGRRG
jgi:DNA mismatch repair protein MutL